MKFTEEQQKVIDARDCNLLVAAAAGSGKTAVLVERIIARITDAAHPLDIDRLLIVTYTNAAAAEMRERIGAAIENCIAKCPEDVHLQRQQTLLHTAQITTIHSFCLYIIRNYFHRIDLDPDFRIGEEGELKLLKQDVLEQVLEEYYQKAEDDFLHLSETLATGKNDEKLKETIFSLYEFAMSDPWPEEWLKGCMGAYEVSNLEELQKQPIYEVLLQYLKVVTSQWVQMMEHNLVLCEEADGPDMYREVLEREYEMLKQTSCCNSYEAYGKVLAEMSFGRLPAARKFQGDGAKKQYVQEQRNKIKDSRKKLLEQFFFLPPEVMAENLEKNKAIVSMLVQVTISFKKAYEEKKREKNMLDFNDLEHFALHILVEEDTREPSRTAQELREQFEEIMIDEYQDSNYVQEAILRSVARKNNRFMVGDVKQSIYRFRMARPELFMEKYGSYRNVDKNVAENVDKNVDTNRKGENRKIDLHKNFRSRGEVLQTVNDIFYSVMAENLGNVEYDKQAALYQGMEFLEDSNPQMFRTEILLADPDVFSQAGNAEDIKDVEAVMIAEKIRQLMEQQKVTDKESGKLRPMQYKDVVILLRGIGGYGQQMAEILKEHGIPAMVTTQTGYFSAIEVQTVLNLLRLIDNPRQDIPMAAILQSPIVGLTSEELAAIRIEFREMPFYQGVVCYGKEGSKKQLRRQIAEFLQEIDDFRKSACDMSVHELLYLVMDKTGYLDYVSALPGGAVRRANLEMLSEQAISYEATSYHGLFQFIRYVNQLQKYEVDYGEAEDASMENAVRIMTIHKSKGLEFPVVFVAGLGRQLNQQDVRSRMVLHPRYGIGLDITDLKQRVRTPSLMRQVLARQIQMENAGEELRILYVALTRAREKLILTGTMKKAEEKLLAYQYEQMDQQGHMGFLARLNVGCYLEWILPPLIQKQEYYIHVATPEEFTISQGERKVQQEWKKEWLVQLSEHANQDLVEEIEQRLSCRYPYEEEQELKTKLSVSELKHRAIDKLHQEEADTVRVFEEPPVIPYIPEFMQEEAKKAEENTGALRGTAMHRVLECFDFSRPFDTLEGQVEEMRKSRKLEQRLWELISWPNLEEFFQTQLAERMQQAARNGMLYREKPFVMGKAASEVTEHENCKVMVLVQGIIDAFFEEDGQLVLVDYKTDAVKTSKELAMRYQTQLDLYQEALERATQKKVKEKILYSFRLKEAIIV